MPEIPAGAEPGSGIEFLAADYLSVLGTRLYYRHCTGKDPTLLFLPGGAVDHIGLTWKHVVRSLAGQYRIIAPDLPGFGRSSGDPSSAYSTAYLAETVRRFMRATDTEYPIILANSFGAAVALRLALENPESVRGLVLTGAYGWQPRVRLHHFIYGLSRAPAAGRLARLAVDIPGVVEAGLWVTTANWARVDRELIRDAKRGAAARAAPAAFMAWTRSELLWNGVRSDFTGRLPEIHLPVLVLQGAHDRVFPLRYAQRAAALMPQARLHVFDAGHLVPRECPEEAIEHIISFLEEVA